MIKNSFKKIISLGIIAASILAINPVGASAEWRQDSKGWWYSKGNSWATGWYPIDGKFYYFNNNGYMVANSNINGMQLGSDGACVINAPTATGNANSNKSTGVYTWGTDLKDMNSKNARIEYADESSDKIVKDNLNNEYSNFLTLSMCSYASDDSLGYVEFPLNGQFKQFKSKLGLTKEDQENLENGIVKIYLDDEEVYSTEIKSGDLLKDININLTGKQKIKFYFRIPQEGGNGWEQIGFFNGQFTK